MARVKITASDLDRWLAEIEAGGIDKKIDRFDTTPGFAGLVVRQTAKGRRTNGSLSYQMVYGPDRKCYGLGSYPNVTLTHARASFKQAKKADDPQGDKTAARRMARQMPTLERLRAEYEATDSRTRAVRTSRVCARRTDGYREGLPAAAASRP